MLGKIPGEYLGHMTHYTLPTVTVQYKEGSEFIHDWT